MQTNLKSLDKYLVMNIIVPINKKEKKKISSY